MQKKDLTSTELASCSDFEDNGFLMVDASSALLVDSPARRCASHWLKIFLGIDFFSFTLHHSLFTVSALLEDALAQIRLLIIQFRFE